jgi:plastocyanin
MVMRTNAVLAALAAAALAATTAACSSSTANHVTSSTGPAGSSHAAASAAASATSAAAISVSGFAFAPATLTVSPGQQVTVANHDSVAHTVTATGGAFDTGDITPGGSATFTAPAKAGDYPYDCTIHPFMKGTLTVR